jgi:hypothetical protein
VSIMRLKLVSFSNFLMIIVSMSEESKEIIPNLKPSEGMQIQLLQEVKTVNVKNNDRDKSQHRFMRGWI